MLTKIKELLLYSSENKEKFSLTLKSVVGFLFLFYGWGSVDKEALEGATNELITLILNASILFGEVFAAISAIYGAGRKVKNLIIKKTA